MPPVKPKNSEEQARGKIEGREALRQQLIGKMLERAARVFAARVDESLRLYCLAKLPDIVSWPVPGKDGPLIFVITSEKLSVPAPTALVNGPDPPSMS